MFRKRIFATLLSFGILPLGHATTSQPPGPYATIKEVGLMVIERETIQQSPVTLRGQRYNYEPVEVSIQYGPSTRIPVNMVVQEHSQYERTKLDLARQHCGRDINPDTLTRAVMPTGRVQGLKPRVSKANVIAIEARIDSLNNLPDFSTIDCSKLQ
jgi:hypothetical protein